MTSAYRLVAVCALVVGALALVGCGSSGDSRAPVTTSATPAPVVHVSADPCSTAAATTLHANLRARCTRGSEVEHVERPVVRPSAATSAATCASPAVVQAYAQDDWLGLARSLAAAPEGCLEAWISVPTEPGADGAWLTTRPGMKQVFARIGGNVRPMPEVNFNDWNAWGKKHPDVSWFERGVRARAEMEKAGYDFNRGDRWALNEVPVAALRSGADRDAVRDLVRGLQGRSRSPTGVVYVVMSMQSDSMTAELKKQLAGWYAEAPFWAEMRKAVVAWSVEAYASVLDTCAPDTTARQQVAALHAYAFSAERVAERLALPDEAAVHAVLRRGVPLANGAWSWADAYGYTAVSPQTMKRFVALQVAAMGQTLPGDDHLTVGFAWAPKRPDGVGKAAYRRDLAAISAAVRDAVVNQNRTRDRVKLEPCRHPGASLADWTG